MNNATMPQAVAAKGQMPRKGPKSFGLVRAVPAGFEPFFAGAGLTGSLALPKYRAHALALTEPECCNVLIVEQFQKLRKEDPNEIPSAWRPRRGPPHQGRSEDRWRHHHPRYRRGKAPGGRSHLGRPWR